MNIETGGSMVKLILGGLLTLGLLTIFLNDKSKMGKGILLVIIILALICLPQFIDYYL